MQSRGIDFDGLKWFNTAAFAAPAQNMLRDGLQRDQNRGLQKSRHLIVLQIPIYLEAELKIRLDMFNTQGSNLSIASNFGIFSTMANSRPRLQMSGQQFRMGRDGQPRTQIQTLEKRIDEPKGIFSKRDIGSRTLSDGQGF
jgi:hypothetical protein